jgi:hypothetical protein
MAPTQQPQQTHRVIVMNNARLHERWDGKQWICYRVTAP